MNNYLKKYSDYELHEIATNKLMPEWVKDRTADEAFEIGYWHALMAARDNNVIVEDIEDEA